MTAGRVLLVDREPAFRRALARALVAQRFEVATAETLAAAGPLLAASSFDVALLGHTGADAAPDRRVERLRASHDVEVLLLLDPWSPEGAIDAQRLGAYDALPRPDGAPDVLVGPLRRAAEKKLLSGRLRELEQRLEQRPTDGELVGSSPSMRELFRVALGVADARAPVLLRGEPGTGKRMLARAIHRESLRRQRPLVTMHCAALPADETERELFGDDGGGHLEAADRGALLLEEVSALSLSAQARLLTLLRDGRADPASAAPARPADVRLFATSSADLRAEIRAGRFRQDLYYRLQVVTLWLPPLRRRRDDIPLLAQHFLEKYRARSAHRVLRVGPGAIRELRSRSFRGNVAELEACIERAALFARGETLFPSDLPPPEAERSLTLDEQEQGPGAAPALTLPGGWADLPYAASKEAVMAAFHASYMAALLAQTGGNTAEAARRAGLDPSNLRRVLRRRGAARGRGGGEP